MTAEGDSPDGPAIAAAQPHCGVCRHVYFQDDWNQTPYCSLWDLPTAIRVGRTCAAFEQRK